MEISSRTLLKMTENLIIEFFHNSGVPNVFAILVKRSKLCKLLQKSSFVRNDVNDVFCES